MSLKIEETSTSNENTTEVVESLPSNIRTNPMDNYTRYCRPVLGGLLSAAGLDKDYHRGEGDFLYYYDENGQEREVIDFLGGYGSLLFGHNHPELLKVAMDTYLSKMPFSAQTSCRSAAGMLAEKINQFMQERFKKNFITTFSNTGTEAVEAAIKHAELAKRKKLQSISKKLTDNFTKIRKGLAEGEFETTVEFHMKAGRLFPFLDSVSYENVISAINNHNQRLFRKVPVFLALEKSFHGKTSGSVKLTYNDKYREPFQRIGVAAEFVNPEDTDSLRSVIEANSLRYYDVLTKKGKVVDIVERVIYNVTGMFVESLQGEGGIHVIPTDFLKLCRDLADEKDFPLIFDEIQSGMGRTGTFFHSEQSGVMGDYYLLSKSLGGGLAKIAALIINEKKYELDFGMVHTSTFAEDTHSCSIALRGLELIEENPNLMANCLKQGETIKAGLLRLKEKYPEVIKDVRGVGLMIGIEFLPQKAHGSPLIASLSSHQQLTPFIAGYLLHEHGIRIAPTLSAGDVIRIQPSAFIENDSIASLLFAFERVVDSIQKQNSYELTKCFIGKATPGVYNEVQNFRVERDKRLDNPAMKKIAFVAHLIEPENARVSENSFVLYSDEELTQLIRSNYRIYDKILYDEIVITSITGEETALGFIGLPFDSEVIVEHMRRKDTAWMQEQLHACVDYAVENQYSAIGFGGFTSIIMNNCKKITRDDIAVTTGNSLTVAMGLEGIFQAAREGDIDLGKSTFAGIGANGNICSIYSRIMAEQVPEIILVGREGREGALEQLADVIYTDALKEICMGRTLAKTGSDFQEPKGVAKAIVDTKAVQELFARDINLRDIELHSGAVVAALKQELKEDLPVKISTDINDIKKANLILSASNSAKPIIKPEMLSTEKVVVCDIAVPRDTDDSLAAMENVTLILGGVVKLPLNADFGVGGIPLPEGHAYACMSETILMGLQGITESYSVGSLNKMQVKKIMDIAKIHGFSLGLLKDSVSF